MRINKFGNKRTNFAGIWFHSKLETSVYGLLLLREKAKEIKILKLQKRERFHTYEDGWVIMIPDFQVQDLKTGEVFYVEAKGFEQAKWRKKRKAWLRGGPGRMEIWKGSHKNPGLAETLVPKGKEK